MKFNIPLILVTLFSTSSIYSLHAADEFSMTSPSKSDLEWSSKGNWTNIRLRVTGNGIFDFERTFKAGETVQMPTADLPDGQYQWELTASTSPSNATKKAIANARAAGDEALAESLALAAGIASTTSSGSFSRIGGVTNSSSNTPKSSRQKNDRPMGPVTQDAVIADDQIIQGSLAVGLDAVVNESFGFDTIRVKENNARISFHDTSAVGFASNDWTIEANESGSGGANYLGFRDKGDSNDTGSEAGIMPFRIAAGASEGALWVDSTNRVGLGTTTPTLHLSLADSNTPAIRLEQNSNGGFTAQTWDVAGNEANFFVRDVTGGSRLPFRIRPGAPTSSIDISASGNVGIGTASPTSSLNISRSDGSAMVKVQETSATSAARNLVELENNGQSRIKMVNTAAIADAGGGGWIMNAKDGTAFAIRTITLSAPPKTDFLLERGGKLTLLGSANATAFNTTSDINLKKDIVSVKPREILEKVSELTIGEWSFITGDDDVRHMGPMAQDFKKQFGLGPSDKTINVMDSAGVALAAIQGLKEILNERETEIKDLSAQMKELRKELESIRKLQRRNKIHSNEINPASASCTSHDAEA